MADPFVYLLVDGENIDRTLGQILDGKPRPDQRPRWEKVRAFVEKRWGRAARALFFLNASRGLPGSFIQALRVSGFIPIPLAGTSDQKVVDLAILKTLEALAARPGDVVLVSHDADFKAAFAALGDRRRRGLLAFREYLGGEFVDIPGLELLDLEDDVGAFECGPLPRVRVIRIEEFDPNRYLG
jgi:putative heme uptake system protein